MDDPPPNAAASSGLSRRALLATSLAAATGAALPPAVRRGSPTSSRRTAGTAVDAAAERFAAAPYRIFLAPDDHTDYLWSADAATYDAVFADTLDYYLDQIDRSEADGVPPEQHARWNCDGWLWVDAYERLRTSEQFARLIARIKDGHISVPMNALVLVQGGAPLEAVLRGMFYAGALERRFGLRLPMAVAMENQTLPYGLGSLWAGSGARYSWKGICGCATRVPDAGNRPHDIYWWVGPDGSRILMKWHSLLGANDGSGGYAEMRHAAAAVEFVTPGTGDPRFRERYPFDVIGLFGQGWDDLATRSDAAVEAARSLSDDRRDVIVSNQVDFFTEFEARYGQGIPEEGAAYGNEWDLLIASMNETSARVRRAVERLRTAEAIAAIVALDEPGAVEARPVERARCFANLGLYYEHDWTADGVIPRAERAAWQIKLADEIEAYVGALHDDAGQRLAAQIGTGGPAAAASGEERWFVFNALGWARTDIVDLDVDGGPRPVTVIDVTTGIALIAQWVSDPFDLSHAPRLRVRVDDVPAVGYRVVAVRDGDPSPSEPAVARNGDALVNDHFQVDVGADGQIRRLIDRVRANRNVGPAADRACNQLVSLSHATTADPTTIRRSGSDGPVTARLVSDVASPADHTTAISLHAGIARVDIDSRIVGAFDDVLGWRFSFDVDDPVVMHEEIGAIIAARLRGDGGHYSARAARYDWLTFNHFSAIGPRSGDGPWVVLANRDCHFQRLGDSTPDRLVTDDPTITALAGGQVDGPALGIPAQGGVDRHHYRFSITTQDRFDAAAAMRFALEATNPLHAARVSGTHGGRPADRWGLLSVSDPDVVLWSVKPAEDAAPGRLSVRLWNLAGRDATPTVRLRPPYALHEAVRTTHIETPIAPEGLRDGGLPAELREAEIGTWQLSVGRPKRGSGQVIWLPDVRDGG
ncbi:MAG: glycoside hydrolase [Ardenticatenales bacterium]